MCPIKLFMNHSGGCTYNLFMYRDIQNEPCTKVSVYLPIFPSSPILQFLFCFKTFCLCILFLVNYFAYIINCRMSKPKWSLSNNSILVMAFRQIVFMEHVMNFDCTGFCARKRISQKILPGGGSLVGDAKSSAL